MTDGYVVWFTGLSGSGKTSLARLVATELGHRGARVEVLDGDEVRKNFDEELGFGKVDRDLNVRRIGQMAGAVARAGDCAVVAAISPYHEVRDEVRHSVARFCEVYCECPLDVLMQRDPKGLYRKALRGELVNFTGLDDPYQPPQRPELHLRTDQELPGASAARVVRALEALGFIPVQK